MNVAASSVLYYPQIDITDHEWLRVAALFWDSVQTIVPKGIKTPYQSNFSQQLYDEGILKPLLVSSDMPEIEDLSDDVLNYLTDPASIGLLLPDDGRGESVIYPEKLPRIISKIAHIYPEKLPYEIRHSLDELGENAPIRTSNEFSNFYMTLLATRLAQDAGLGLVTNLKYADQLSVSARNGKALGNSDVSRGEWRHREARDRRRLPRTVNNGLMFDCIMSGITIPPDVSAKALIKFRNSHKEELSVLRQHINTLVADIPADLTVEALRQKLIDQYAANVAPAMKSLKESLRLQSWETSLNGFLKISALTLPTSGAMMLAGIPSSIALLASTGISITATVVQTIRERRDLLSKSPYAYLLSIDKKW